MSDINLDFTVSNNSINFTLEPNDITFTPTDVVLTFNPNFQPLAGGSLTQLQYNNGGVLAGVGNTSYVSGNLTLGDVANIKITGGTNGYVLQTDGAGNLDWAATGGGGGNGSPGGSNTQIQYNDGGTFGGNTGFTFNEVSGNVNMPGNLSVVGNIFGNFSVANANYANFANYANYSNISNLANSVAGSNVTGQVAYAAIANSVAGANVTGQIANALIAGTVYTNAQPNITSVGILTDLFVSNTKIHLGANAAANGQGNSSIAIGDQAQAFALAGTKAISIGYRAGYNSASDLSISIGANAGYYNPSSNTILIGSNAGGSSQSGAIAIGANAGATTQQSNAIAIGANAGSTTQGASSIAIGVEAGATNLGAGSTAIGVRAGASYTSAIVLNATNANLFATQASSLFIKPIRDVTGNASFTVTLKYNPTTGEIGYV
jgi:hypothetical protein